MLHISNFLNFKFYKVSQRKEIYSYPRENCLTKTFPTGEIISSYQMLLFFLVSGDGTALPGILFTQINRSNISNSSFLFLAPLTVNYLSENKTKYQIFKKQAKKAFQLYSMENLRLTLSFQVMITCISTLWQPNAKRLILENFRTGSLNNELLFVI